MTLNCKGQLIDISSPKVMGILNVTPDSFYDGGRFKTDKDILIQVEKILTEGAAFIDIGGYSSRPGADHISKNEELQRLLPIIEILLKNFPEILLSVDTFRSQVAKESVALGAAMINDISAGMMDDKMLETVGKLQVPYIMMHMKGTPQTMKKEANYDDLLKEIIYYFSERVATAREHQICDIIIDPGFGFAKTIAHNFSLLNKLELLRILDLPMLIGLSRKSMIYKTLNTTATEALNGTTALNSLALYKGANILRVHDVKAAMECVTLINELR